jgi:hypothetical protein
MMFKPNPAKFKVMGSYSLALHCEEGHVRDEIVLLAVP